MARKRKKKRKSVRRSAPRPSIVNIIGGRGMHGPADRAAKEAAERTRIESILREKGLIQ